jgi:hypothetical protein
MWSVTGPVAVAVAAAPFVVGVVVVVGRPPPTPPLHDDDGSADDDDDRNDDDDDDATMVATTAVSPSSGGAPPRRTGWRWVRGIEAKPTLTATKPRGDERSSETWSRFIDGGSLLRGCLIGRADYCTFDLLYAPRPKQAKKQPAASIEARQ